MSDIFKRIKKSSESANIPPTPDGAWDNFESFRKSKNQTRGTKLYPVIIGAMAGLLLMSNVAWWTHTSSLQSSMNTHEVDTIYVDRPVKVVEQMVVNTALISSASNNDEKTNSGVGERASTTGISPSSDIDKRRTSLELDKAKLEIAQLQSKVSLLKNKVSNLNSAHFSLKNQLAESKKSMEYIAQPTLDQGGSSRLVLDDSMELDGNLNSDIACVDALTLGQIAMNDNRQLKENYEEVEFDDMPSFSLKRFLRPQSYALGVNVGVLFGSNLKYGNPLNQSYGLGGSAYLSEKIRVNTSAMYFKGKSKIRDISMFQDLPSSVAPDGGELQYVDVLGDGYMIDASIEYLFYKQKRMVPFIGLGWGYSKNRYNEFDFEYSTENNEIYLRVEDYDNFEKINMGLVSLGFDLSLSKYFQVKLTSSYYMDMSKKNSGYIHIRPSLKYTINR